MGVGVSISVPLHSGRQSSVLSPCHLSPLSWAPALPLPQLAYPWLSIPGRSAGETGRGYRGQRLPWTHLKQEEALDSTSILSATYLTGTLSTMEGKGAQGGVLTWAGRDGAQKVVSAK